MAGVKEKTPFVGPEANLSGSTISFVNRTRIGSVFKRFLGECSDTSSVSMGGRFSVFEESSCEVLFFGSCDVQADKDRSMPESKKRMNMVFPS